MNTLFQLSEFLGPPVLRFEPGQSGARVQAVRLAVED